MYEDILKCTKMFENVRMTSEMYETCLVSSLEL